jgi:integrase
MSFGSYPAVSLAEARKALAIAQEAVQRGEDPALTEREDRRAYVESATVADLAETYLDRHARPKKKPRSAAEDERMLRSHVIPALGYKKVVDVKRRDLADLIHAEYSRIVAAGGTGTAANRLKAVISKMFRLAVRWGWIDASPAIDLEAPAPETARDRVLTADEIAAFWSAIESPGSEMDEKTGLALCLILVTGQRPGEIAAMKRNDLDLKAKTWMISDTKNRRPHLVPLSLLALNLIGQVLKRHNSEYVFPARSDAKREPHIHRESLSRAAHRLSRHVGEPWRPHDLRRSAITGMARLGVSRFMVDRVTNHVDQSVTGRHYDLHDYEAEKREALNSWASELERVCAIAREPPQNVLRLQERT